MTYVLKNLPADVEKALQQRARASHQPVDAVIENIVVQSVRDDKHPDAITPATDSQPKRDLSDIAGTWVEDPAFDEAIAAQRVVDPDAWR